METKRFTLTIGQRDQSDFTKIIPVETARELILKSVIQYFDGCTLQAAEGYYTTDAGDKISEPSIMVIIDDYSQAGRDAILKVIHEIKISMNQESISLRTESIESELL